MSLILVTRPMEPWRVLTLLVTGVVGAWCGFTLRDTPENFPPAALGYISAVVMALITADFAIGAVPKFRRAEVMRPMAADIEAAVPPAEPLAVLRPGYLPYLYYLRPGLVYVQRIGDLPEAVHYVLVRQNDLPTVETTLRERHDTYRIDLRVKDKRLKNDPAAHWLLLRLNPLPEPGL